jgi:hypothetical protein
MTINVFVKKVELRSSNIERRFLFFLASFKCDVIFKIINKSKLNNNRLEFNNDF